MQHRLHTAILATLLVSYLLLLAPSPTTGASVSQGGREEGQDGEKQWDTSFPYLLMMMQSNGAAVVPSPWLIPVVIAGGVMLFIRGTIDWM